MQIVCITGNVNIEDALRIRRQVFIEEQNVSEQEEFDDLDDQSTHIMLYKDNLCVATGRMYCEKESVMHIGRIAVSKEFRSFGYGKTLMLELLNRAFQVEGINEIVISAQCRVIGFYEKLGFIKRGNTYIDANIPHVELSLLKVKYVTA